MARKQKGPAPGTIAAPPPKPHPKTITPRVTPRVTGEKTPEYVPDDGHIDSRKATDAWTPSPATVRGAAKVDRGKRAR